VKLLPLDEKEQVTEIAAVSSFDQGDFLVLATRSGEIKKIALRGFASVRSSGLIAMDLNEGDELIAARVARKGDELILLSEGGHAIRFSSERLRNASRASGGVRGIQLPAGDCLVAMDIVSPQDHLLVVTANGFGKRTSLKAYRPQFRGGKGVKSLNITPKIGRVAAARVVDPSQELVIASAQGHVIRVNVENVPVQGRIRRGANIMELEEGDEVVAVACLEGQAKHS
jgi:DNA gyrase subunit A